MALVEYKLQDKIAYITLNRPEKLNAISDEMSVEICNALYKLNDDPAAHIGIISGNGRAFSSGADVRQRQMRTKEEFERLGRAAGREGTLQTPFFRSSQAKPLIAAAHGYVLGIGLRIALFCDILVADKGTQFQVKEVSRGLNATDYWAVMAQRGAGAFGTEVALTGRFWTAEEGLTNGVVTRVSEPGERIQVAESLARMILENPPLSVRAVVEARRAIIEEVDTKAHAMRPRTLHLTEDFQESARAFVEKRKPVYKGR